MIAKKPKFSLIALIALILAVTVAAGCSFTGPSIAPSNSKVLEFPGTQWGMTLEQVMEALELTENDVTIEVDSSGYFVNMETELDNVFGASGTVIFNFQTLDTTLEYEYLDNVYVTYPDATNMNAVRRRMTRVYGDPSLYDAPPMVNTGKLKSSEGHVSRWDSGTLLGEYMSDAHIDYLAQTLTFSGAYEYGLHEANKMKEHHAAIIWWTDNGKWMASATADSDTSGYKGLVFSANELAYLRAIENTGWLREIPTDESLLPKSHYALRIDAINCIVRQEQVAEIAIADSRINIKEVTTRTQPISSVFESRLYEVTWQVRPETSEGILLGKGVLFRDGWIIPAEPTYYMVEHREGISGNVNGIPITEETTITARRTASALEAEYGTPEMLEKYGDMFTAFMMENAREVNLEIKP